MKKFKLILPFFLLGLIFTSCSKDDDITEPIVDPVEEALEVENFIYRGLNNIYFYKADVPELADNYFSDKAERNEFLASFESPEALFSDGLTAPQDQFSFLVDDYIALEKSFSGISTTNGMELAFYLYGNNEILAIVNYVLPNTSAEEQGIKRGDAFTIVDGQQMTENNYKDLLAPSNYTITLAQLKDNIISQTEETVSLSKEEYNTNPIYINKTLDVNGIKVGYLMYNSFTDTYDEQLNAAFAELNAAGVTELILDLRYNGGGSVATAVGLAGMITGQFKGEIFLKEQWNERYQNAWDPESYLIRFSDKITLNRFSDNPTEILINSLGLNKVYVLTTNRSASASELIINGLDPYIDVVHVGTTTAGKFQASTTLYDSPGLFNKENINQNHTYAIQPLIYKSANADGVTDYKDGLNPDIEIAEDLNNMGTLGNESETLLNAALNDILGLPQNQEKTASAKRASEKFKNIGGSGMEDPTYQKMYIEKLPPNLKK